jgi:hypothetical protein
MCAKGDCEVIEHKSEMSSVRNRIPQKQLSSWLSTDIHPYTINTYRWDN